MACPLWDPVQEGEKKTSLRDERAFVEESSRGWGVFNGKSMIKILLFSFKKLKLKTAQNVIFSINENSRLHKKKRVDKALVCGKL